MRPSTAGHDLEKSGVTRRVLEFALSRERRPVLQKRLNALLLLLSGASIREAAKELGASSSAVHAWLHIAREHKLSALLADRRANNCHGRPRGPLLPADVREVREQIVKALRRRPNWRLRRRLEAVDFVLRGGTPEDAAATVGVRSTAVRKWLNTIRHKGVAGFLEQSDWRACSSRLDIDSAALHERAAKEWNPRIRKRMLAVAYVADGMGYYDAGVAAGLNPQAVTMWVERVRRNGIDEFRKTKA